MFNELHVYPLQLLLLRGGLFPKQKAYQIYNHLYLKHTGSLQYHLASGPLYPCRTFDNVAFPFQLYRPAERPMPTSTLYTNDLYFWRSTPRNKAHLGSGYMNIIEYIHQNQNTCGWPINTSCVGHKDWTKLSSPPPHSHGRCPLRSNYRPSSIVSQDENRWWLKMPDHRLKRSENDVLNIMEKKTDHKNSSPVGTWVLSTDTFLTWRAHGMHKMEYIVS